jgi:ABC-type antimicrobial peptide transport system ATPase subunit
LAAKNSENSEESAVRVIAAAFATSPMLVIADEPTTALYVTTQAADHRPVARPRRRSLGLIGFEAGGIVAR